MSTFRDKKSIFGLTSLIILIIVVLSGCNANQKPVSEKTITAIPIVPTITPHRVLKTVFVSNEIPTKTSTPLPVIFLTPTFDQPSGCRKPAESYELVEINGMVINQRTYEMLLHAQKLYGGEIALTSYHLTQGSYNNTVSASFGTHDGGGAADFSVFRYGTYQVLYNDIEPLIFALRTAGFAAWLRDFDQLYPGSPIHIHVIAIGDRDLSPSAEAQLTSNYGYFNGYNGIPPENGAAPVLDEFGGPIICEWMIPFENKSLLDSPP